MRFLIFVSYIIFIQIHTLQNVVCFDPLSIAGAIGAIALSSFIYYYKESIKRPDIIQQCDENFEHCSKNWNERCDKNWILNDIHKLQHDLETKVYGQHLAINTIISAIKSHKMNENLQKPLVIALHGWTGSGKNYVSSIIAESLYKRGADSQFVHLLVSTLHFPHVSKSREYSDNLRNWIKGNVTYCPHQLFIFDEVDFMPPDLMHYLKPFFDYKTIDGIDFRHAIYLLLTNNGGSEIAQTALEFWDQGKEREKITLGDMEDMLSEKAFNQKGGLWHSSLIDKHLIDLYVPFLPLERKHVKLCAWYRLRHHLERRKRYVEANIYGDYNEPSRTFSNKELESVVDKVTNSMSYYPKLKNIFSTSGCKRVESKIDLYLEQLISS